MIVVMKKPERIKQYNIIIALDHGEENTKLTKDSTKQIIQIKQLHSQSKEPSTIPYTK